MKPRGAVHWSLASAPGSETGADIAGVRAVLTLLVAVGLKSGPAPGAGVGGDGVALKHHGVGVPPGHAASPATEPLPTPGLADDLSAVFTRHIGGGYVWGDVVAPAPRFDCVSTHAGYLCDLPESGTAFTQGDDFSLHVWLHGPLTVLSPIRPCPSRKPDTTLDLWGSTRGAAVLYAATSRW